MAWNRGQWFIGVGVLAGWLGAGCETSDMQHVPGQETAPPGLAADDGLPSVGAADTPVQADPGTQPEQPREDVPAPSGSSLPGCEAVPLIQPADLVAWKSMTRSTSTRGYCGDAAADGAGNILLTATPANDMSMSFVVQAPDGSSWDGAIPNVNTMSASSQAQGFLGRSFHPLESTTWLTFIDSVNRRVIVHSEEPLGQPWGAVNPAGGLHEIHEDGTLKAYSGTGQLRWSTSLAPLLSGPVSALGVNTEGHTLVLSVGGAAVEGVWVDSSGQPGTPFLALTLENPAPFTRYGLAPLVQGGLVLSAENHSGRSWIAAFDSLQASSGPVPAWLGAGDGRPFDLLPGGKGYIRWERVNGSTSACQYEAQLTAPSGESCGTVRLPGMDTGDSCGFLSMGRDGTVVENLPPEDISGDRPYQKCRARWWPALFR